MGKKLYVGNMSFNVTEDSLRDLFQTVGEVDSVKIITDTYTGKSKGFGFVEMASDGDAQKAIANLNGTAFMERTLTVSEARPQRQRERGGFSGDRGRGGFGGGMGSGYGRGKR
jgi:RNA recognition motif-containing protein